MIRTTRHSLKFTNTEKLKRLKSFIKEYRRVSQVYLDYLGSKLMSSLAFIEVKGVQIVDWCVNLKGKINFTNVKSVDLNQILT